MSALGESDASFWHLPAATVNFPYVSIYKTDLSLPLKIHLLYIFLNYADYEDRVLCGSVWLYVLKLLKYQEIKAYNYYFKCYSWHVVKECHSYKTSSEDLEIKGNRFPIERRMCKQSQMI